MCIYIHAKYIYYIMCTTWQFQTQYVPVRNYMYSQIEFFNSFRLSFFYLRALENESRRDVMFQTKVDVSEDGVIKELIAKFTLLAI